MLVLAIEVARSKEPVDNDTKPTEGRDPKEEFLRPPIEHKKSRWGFRGMTVRDWMPIVGALLIPVVIAAGTLGITWQQGKSEDQRAQQAQKLENQRSEAERNIQQQNAQDEALQAYLNEMSSLLLKEDLRTSDEDSEVRTLARARTLTVVSRLDGSRKGSVVRFLTEAGLINRENPIIALGGIRRSQLGLRGLDQQNVTPGVPVDEPRDRGLLISRSKDAALALSGAKLAKANLDGADLSGTNLSHVDLSFAELNSADLTNANLSGSILFGANLIGADLRGATLDNAALQWANLYQASFTHGEMQHLADRGALTGAIVPDGSRPFPASPEVDHLLSAQPESVLAQRKRTLEKFARQIERYSDSR
jgi:uncharacterized protein YjbI with pentapeptide repeats